MKRIISMLIILLISLCAVLSGCSTNEQETPATSNNASESEQNLSDGESVISLTVDVVDKDGNAETFSFETDADNLADALLGAQIVEGEDGAYGLYIKYANGIRADYDLDGAYWALYSNGEMLMNGASDIPIADGEHYELVYTAG